MGTAHDSGDWIGVHAPGTPDWSVLQPTNTRWFGQTAEGPRWAKITDQDTSENWAWDGHWEFGPVISGAARVRFDGAYHQMVGYLDPPYENEYGVHNP